MNLKIFTAFLILIIANINSYSQSTDNFVDLIETMEDGKLKIFLDGVFKISFKECSDFYMIADFDDKYLSFKDSIKIYYPNGKLLIKGNFENGKLNGKFSSFHKNGLVKMKFEYLYGKRNGTWSSFSKSGQLLKKVEYIDNNELLIEKYNHNGESTVLNGTGKFTDSINLSIASSKKSFISGHVKQGLPDGEWNYYSSGVNYSKEYFKDFTFIKGISISKVLGNESYYDHFNATFTGVMFLERLKLIGASICNSTREIGVNDEFYEKVKEKFYKQQLNETIINDWFWIQIKTGKNKKIVDVSIVSKANESSINLIRNVIFSLKKAITFPYKYKPGYDFFPLVVKDSKIYLPYDKEIEILTYKY